MPPIIDGTVSDHGKYEDDFITWRDDLAAVWAWLRKWWAK